jgi:ferrous-iron efflux pump FieF
MRLATYASVGTAFILIAVKVAAAVMTGSVSLLSTLLDSLLDGAASMLNLFAVSHALIPADREHRFGHGKVEALAALGQSAFITGSSVFLIFEVINRLLDPQPIERSGLAIAVLVFSIVVTVALVAYQRHVVRHTNSLAIRSDSMHYFGDLLVNGAVIVAVLLTAELGWLYADPLIAAGVAAYILYMAWGIAKGALDMLMDRELPDAERNRIKAIAQADPRVLSIHDLKTRAAGRQYFIQIHLEMDGRMSLDQAHEVSDAVEARLREAFPEAEVMIHQDPAGIEETRQTFA